jgi:hypothetical protein
MSKYGTRIDSNETGLEVKQWLDNPTKVRRKLEI